MRVSDLFIYPLKSARGIAIPSAAIDAFGLTGDRRAMLVDPSGHFITQRELQALAQIDIQPGPSNLRLKMEGKLDIIVPPPHPDNRMDVIVWKSAVSASVADEETNKALSDWLKRDVKMVFFDGLAKRVANPEWAGDDTPVTFSDGYQILVTTTGSLKALNANLLPMAKALWAWSASVRTSSSIATRRGRKIAGRRSRSAASASIWSSPARAAS